MPTTNGNNLEKSSKQGQVKKTSIWANIGFGILGLLALIVGRPISSNTSARSSVTSPVAGLTPTTPPESPPQGQMVPQIKMEIEGNTYIVNSNDQKITIEKNVTERIINGDTIIENYAEQRTTIEPAGISASVNPVPAAASDLTMDKILTTATSFAVLATNLLLLVKAKKDLSAPKSSPVIFVSVGTRTGFFITHNSDVKEVEENLKGTFHQGQVTIHHNVEIIEDDEKKNTGG